MDNDGHLLQLIPHLQYVGQNKTVLFPACGPNPVLSQMGSWQADACSPQLPFCLSHWMRSNNTDIRSAMSEEQAARGHKAADRPIVTVSLQNEAERERGAQSITRPWH